MTSVIISWCPVPCRSSAVAAEILLLRITLRKPRPMSKNEVVIRPGTIVLTLVLFGISTLFGGVCAAYIYSLFSSGAVAPLPPLLFLANIVVLLFATSFLKKSLGAFDLNDEKRFTRHLFLCLVLSLLFVAFQVVGWIQFFDNIPLNASQARSFLFVLSGLHLLHVLAGLPFLMWFLWMNKGDLNQIRFPRSHRRDYLRGLVRYWRYLDVLWILLVVILTLGYALKWL